MVPDVRVSVLCMVAHQAPDDYFLCLRDCIVVDRVRKELGIGEDVKLVILNFGGQFYQSGVEMIRRDLLTGHWKPYLERTISLKPCYEGGIVY
ncbi:hypothetical protein PTKIN_Ptkin19aG0135300 [Pterospermum kingtungense]